MITWRVAAAWVGALVLATVLTWQIVGLADSQVGEAPVAVAPPSSSTSSADGSTTSTAATSTTASVSITTASTTSTTSPTARPPTTDNPTSTSEAALEWSVRTVTSAGGVVVVRYRPEEVEYEAATPAPGFSLDIEEKGPERVRVDFESEESEVRVEVRWEDGDLVIDVDEDD